MKVFVFMTATIAGVALASAAWARGPAGGMGYGALKGTSNPPRAGHVAAPYGQYTYRPYKPGPTYGPVIRSVRPPLFPTPSKPVSPSTAPYLAVPRHDLVSPFRGPYYYYRW